jgi:hypothetical protein
MIKFKIDDTNKQMVGLGLSYKNLEKLKDGKPMHIKISELGFDSRLEIFIFAGETEKSMALDLHDIIGPDTEVRGFDFEGK